MRIDPLPIDGAWTVTPRQHGDDRGTFLESFKSSALTAATGRPFTVAQVNHSVSAAGVLRGVHFADVPPGQAKYVTCVRGAVLDVVVDVRTGSPTFGAVETVRLDDADRRAVLLTEGLGHGFLALTDDATVVYLVSTEYDPAAEREVSPLSIDWDPAPHLPAGITDPILSAKDAAAPTLAQAAADGILPTYDSSARLTPRQGR